LKGSPHCELVARLNRTVAVGEAAGPRAGLAALAERDPSLHHYTTVAAYLHKIEGDLLTPARSSRGHPRLRSE
jgi:predicted RNA polymerase sigma factor